MKKWLFLVLAICCEVIGSLSMKAAVEAPGFYALTAVGYVGAFVCLFASLRNGMSLGVGYGIWGASGVAATAVMSMMIFGEPITLLMAVGLVAVMLGVLLVEVGSQLAQRNQMDRSGADRGGADGARTPGSTRSTPTATEATR
ncbi:multidrug efflux SMR transporter [Kocuria sp. ChxB]|uniref:DMT family transporter n=1 Tax=Kocuria sp. ChxB TaxID=3035474 RepID=UPI0025EA1B3B|nr:multidrug efflux SMR transporter [uncultured Kocuria sp.]WIW67634.1 multidrug efflux SMR transporter [Kocuria sp. ChxB]